MKTVVDIDLNDQIALSKIDPENKLYAIKSGGGIYLLHKVRHNTDEKGSRWAFISLQNSVCFYCGWQESAKEAILRIGGQYGPEVVEFESLNELAGVWL
jgi:hypothetical protein